MSSFNIGFLRAVKGSIAESLTIAEKQTRALSPEAADSFKAHEELHKAIGAMRMIGLDGCNVICQDMERLALAMRDKNVAVEAGKPALLDGLGAIKRYLDDLLDGALDVPARLFAQYQAVRAALGAEPPTPSELFFPSFDADLGPGGQPLAAPVLEKLVKGERSKFQGALVKWMKDAANPAMAGEAVAQMQAVVDTLGDIGGRKAYSLFWKASGAFFDVLAQAQTDAKRSECRAVISKLDVEMRKFADTDVKKPSEDAFRTMLFHVAQADDSTSDRVAAIREAFGLANYWREVQRAMRESASSAPTINVEEIKEVLAQAKDELVKVVEGSDADKFKKLCSVLAPKIAAFQNPVVKKLSESVAFVADKVAAKEMRLSQLVAEEVAFIFVMLDGVVEKRGRVGSAFDQQVEVQIKRLTAALKNQADVVRQLQSPELDEQSRRDSERALIAHAVGEVKADLGHVEEALDTFFRPGGASADLSKLPETMRSVMGATRILGLDDATRVLGEIARLVEGLAGGTQPSPQDIEKLTDGIGGISLYLDAFQDGAEPEKIMEPMLRLFFAEEPATDSLAEDAAPVEESTFEDALGWAVEPEARERIAPPLMGEGAASEEEADDASPGAEQVPQQPLAQEQSAPVGVWDEPADEELAEIYLEETIEIFEAIQGAMAACEAKPHDKEALTTLRRAYHTLKGSGRMVGLMGLGEAGWMVEHFLNQWISEDRPATRPLLEMVAHSTGRFQGWIEELRVNNKVFVDDRSISARIAALSNPASEQPASAPIQETAAAPAFAPSQVGEPTVKEPELAEPMLADLALEEPTAPALEELAIVEPVVDELVFDEPAAPALEELAIVEPVVGELVFDEPAAPALEEPALVEPAVDELVFDEPAAPALEELAIVEPVVGELVFDEPAALASEEPATVEPVVGELVFDEPAALASEEPAIVEPVVGELVFDEPAASASEELAVVEPVVGELTFDQPAASVSEEPAIMEPVAGELTFEETAEKDPVAPSFDESANLEIIEATPAVDFVLDEQPSSRGADVESAVFEMARETIESPSPMAPEAETKPWEFAPEPVEHSGDELTPDRSEEQDVLAGVEPSREIDAPVVDYSPQEIQSAPTQLAEEPADVVVGDVVVTRELFNIFCSESSDRMRVLSEAMDLLRDSGEIGEPMVRAAHTFGSIGRTVGFHDVSVLGYELEQWAQDKLSHGESADAAQVELADAAVSELRSMVEAICELRMPTSAEEVAEALRMATEFSKSSRSKTVRDHSETPWGEESSFAEGSLEVVDLAFDASPAEQEAQVGSEALSAPRPEEATGTEPAQAAAGLSSDESPMLVGLDGIEAAAEQARAVALDADTPEEMKSAIEIALADIDAIRSRLTSLQSALQSLANEIADGDMEALKKKSLGLEGEQSPLAMLAAWVATGMADAQNALAQAVATLLRAQAWKKARDEQAQSLILSGQELVAGASLGDEMIDCAQGSAVLANETIGLAEPVEPEAIGSDEEAAPEVPFGEIEAELVAARDALLAQDGLPDADPVEASGRDEILPNQSAPGDASQEALVQGGGVEIDSGLASSQPAFGLDFEIDASLAMSDSALSLDFEIDPSLAVSEPVFGMDFEIDPSLAALPEQAQGDQGDRQGASEREQELAEHLAAAVDDLDESLLPLFADEAQDHMPQIATMIAQLRLAPQDAELARVLLRSLHTVKGSARMVGAMRAGAVFHHMESMMEDAERGKVSPAQILEELEALHDRASTMVEQALNPQQAAAVAEAPGAQPVLAKPAESSEQQKIKVSTAAIDRLVNEAGEVRLSGAALSGHLDVMNRWLADLGANAKRQAKMLRELEVQTETQMAARKATADEIGEMFDPLEFDRFTRAQELSRFLAEGMQDILDVQANLERLVRDQESTLIHQDQMSSDIQQTLMGVRLVKFGSISDRLTRVVRQAARELGKTAHLDIRGEGIEIDRGVLDSITAPLEHLLRNSVAHGIEMPQGRREAGKADIGSITLEASHEGNFVSIRLADDGQGLNEEVVRKKAVEKGLMPAAESPTAARLIEMIFMPGFSTADTVSQIAGRGVGMDVVKNEIVSLGGQIDVQTQRGAGMRYSIVLPVSLATTQAILVEAAGQLWAIPAEMVELINSYKATQLAAIQHAGVVVEDGVEYPYAYLPHLLGEHGVAPEQKTYNTLAMVKSADRKIAVHVDRLLGTREVVVKSIGRQMARISGISGATVMGDGRLGIIINPVFLASGRKDDWRLGMGSQTGPKAARASRPTVMVVDDSLTIRKVTSKLLERSGYDVMLAKDGMHALEVLQERLPDVILSDVEMPRMDGFELLKNLKADAKYQNIPVIMITSRTADRHKSTGLALGASVYLGKPYQEEELLGHIEAFLGAGALA